eukprot:SAG11_NODE_1385_length_5070_cov_3.950915_9_plen_146_part_00
MVCPSSSIDGFGNWADRKAFELKLAVEFGTRPNRMNSDAGSRITAGLASWRQLGALEPRSRGSKLCLVNEGGERATLRLGMLRHQLLQHRKVDLCVWGGAHAHTGDVRCASAVGQRPRPFFYSMPHVYSSRARLARSGETSNIRY